MRAWLESYSDRLAAALARPEIFAFLVAVACAGLSVFYRVPDPDLFARVAVGNLITILGEVPRNDPFAYTPLKPVWFDHEWLSGLIFFHVVHGGGEGALLLLKIATCALTAALAAQAATLVSERARPPFGWFVITFYLTVSAWQSSVRSHVFTYLCLAYLIYAFERYRRYGARGALLLVPFIMVVWINAHGGFVTGLGYLGVMTVGLWLKERTVVALPTFVLGASVLAGFVNPYGLSYLHFILEAVSMPRPYVTEWYPPGFREWAYAPFFIVLALLMCVAFPGRRSISGSALVMLALAALFGLRHARLVPVFGLFAMVYGWPIVRSALSRVGAHGHDLGRAFARVFAVSIVVILVPSTLVAVAQRVRDGEPFFDYAPYPDKATEWLWETGASGRLLIDFDRGSFALWRLYPRFQISLDGRYEELYPDSTIELVVAALDPSRPNHPAAFRAIEPTEILVSSDHTGYRNPSIFGEAWRTAYRDERFAILSSRPLVAGSGPASSMWEPRYFDFFAN